MSRIPNATGDAGLKAPGSNRQQSERSPSENKERAYVAASRRGDRSIEARVESAKAASKIHFERTGKRLKISEEIVRREEMYEEEDDHLPIAYRNVNWRQDIPQRFRDYSMIHMGMRQEFGGAPSEEARNKQDMEARVNSEFAAAFPTMIPGYQQPQRPADSVASMPPTPFHASDFISNEWQNTSALSPTAILPTAGQSPGMAQFLPEMQRASSISSHQSMQTPSHESFTMHRNGSTSSTKSAPMMERQGSGGSTLSHGPTLWPSSPGNTDLESFFPGPHSATTPLTPSHAIAQSRSMSIPFPNESRGHRRRREESSSALPSPNHGLPVMSPAHTVPPAKRNRSEAGLAHGRMSGVSQYPFNWEIPGNVQGMILQSPNAEYSSASLAANQQALAHSRFQQGLADQQGVKRVPRLQPPPRKARSPGQHQSSTQPTPHVLRNGNNMLQAQSMQLEPTKKPKLETDEELGMSTIIAKSAATQLASPTEAKPAPKMEPVVEEPAVLVGYPSFDDMGMIGSFGGQDSGNFMSDFDFNGDGTLPQWNMDGGSFSFDDLLQFPASQSDE